MNLTPLQARWPQPWTDNRINHKSLPTNISLSLYNNQKTNFVILFYLRSHAGPSIRMRITRQYMMKTSRKESSSEHPMVRLRRLRRGSCWERWWSSLRLRRCERRWGPAAAADHRMIYLDRARIFRRFRFSLRIRFLRHLALMVQIRAEMNLKKLN